MTSSAASETDRARNRSSGAVGATRCTTARPPPSDRWTSRRTTSGRRSREIRSPYRLGAGDMDLDLRDLDLRGSTLTVVASVAAGSLRVVVPDGAAVEVDAHVGAGDLEVLGRVSEGIDLHRRVVEPGAEGDGRLVLRARAGIGMVEVRRAPS